MNLTAAGDSRYGIEGNVKVKEAHEALIFNTRELGKSSGDSAFWLLCCHWTKPICWSWEMLSLRLAAGNLQTGLTGSSEGGSKSCRLIEKSEPTLGRGGIEGGGGDLSGNGETRQERRDVGPHTSAG